MHQKLGPRQFFGTNELRYDLRGLTLSESVYPSGLRIAPHEHANASLCLILAGVCTQSWDRHTRSAGPMTLTCIPAGQVHANHWHDSGGQVLSLEFSGQWLERLERRATVLDRPAEYIGGALDGLKRRLVEEYRWQDDVSLLALEGVVLELLAECSRSPTEVPPVFRPTWLGRLHELLRARFRDSLSLGDLAVEVGVSADHLARSFRRRYGCTVGEFVRRLRVDFACRQLAASESSLVQVALEAGFTDQSHFTKTFKRHMGMTPAAFRNLHRGRRSRTKE